MSHPYGSAPAPPASSAVKPGAEDGHERDDVPGKLLFKGNALRLFKDADVRLDAAADEAHECGSEAQQPVLVDKDEFGDSPFEKTPHKGAQSGACGS